MVEYTFDDTRSCPECRAEFKSAEQQKQYDPVIVVSCPKCSTLLWCPGFDGTKLYVFDPNADDGI